MVHSNCGWEVKLCDPLSTYAKNESLEISVTQKVLHIQVLFYSSVLNIKDAPKMYV